MKKKLLIILFIPVSILIGQANIDSILEKIKNQPDSSKVTYLNKICFREKNNYPYYALVVGEKALKIARSIKDKSGEAESCNLIGVTHRGIGNYDKSLSYFVKALGAAEECKDSIRIGFAHNNIGSTYRLKSYYTLANNHIFKALKIFEGINHKEGIAYCFMSIGFVYSQQKNFQKALEYYKKAYYLREKIGDKKGRTIALSWIANAFANLGDFKTAIEKYLEAEGESLKSGNRLDLMVEWEGLASVYSKQKNYSLAMKYSQDALNLANQIDNKSGQIRSKANLGYIYANLGRFKEGEKLLKSAVKQSILLSDAYTIMQCYDSFSKLYEQKGDTKNSLKYTRLYIAMKDSVVRKENIASVEELEAIYQHEKGRKENAILHKNIEMATKQTTYLIIITILLVIVSFIISGRYLFKRKIIKELHQLNATKDKLFGIIAHDLRNPFAGINGLIAVLVEEYYELSDEEKLSILHKIDNAGKKTYCLLENLLYWSMSQTGELHHEPQPIYINKIIKETVELFEVTAKNKDILLSAENSADTKVYADERMIKTVLRNLVSNAIKFTRSGGRVSIMMNRKDKFVEIIIQDTGVGISDAVKEKLFSVNSFNTTKGTDGEAGSGLGLILCKEFVEKNGGNIKVESEIEKGSKFIFTLPACD